MLRYPWHEINHSGTSDFIQLFNADLVWSLTTLQSCQKPFNVPKGAYLAWKGQKGALKASGPKGLNIEKNVQK